MKRKIELSIEGLGKLEGFWTPFEDSKPIEPKPDPIEPEPPIEKPEPIEPPIGNDTDWFYAVMKTQNDIYLEKDRVYRVDTLQGIDLDRKLHIKGDNSTILIGVENHEPWKGGESGHLFNLMGNAEFYSRGVNWCIPPQLAIPQRYIPNLFNSAPENDGKWTAIIEDCDTTVFGQNGGMGLGVNYGSKDGNYLALINFKHSGGQLMDLKVPKIDDVLYCVMQNVMTDYLDKNKYNPTYFKTRIKFTSDFSGFDIDGFYGSHCAEVQNEMFFMLNNQFYNRGWNNRLCMINIDRFVFWLPSAQFLQRMVDPILGNKTIWDIRDDRTQTNIGSKVLVNQIPMKGGEYELVRDYDITEHGNKTNIRKNKIRSFANWALEGDEMLSYPIELQPSDVIKIEGQEYTIIHKERGNNYNIEHEWRRCTEQEAQYVYSSLTLDRELPDNVGESFIAEIVKSCAEYLLDGQSYEAYISYKGNSQIDLKPSSTFGDYQILHSPGFGHLSYNHSEISLWAKAVEHNGYYRQSGNGKGKTLGYNMVNCSGFEAEFNPPVEVTTDKPMPKRISDLL